MRHCSIRNDGGARPCVATERVKMPAMHDLIVDAHQCLFSEGQVFSVVVVVLEIRLVYSAQMPLAKNNDMVSAAGTAGTRAIGEPHPTTTRLQCDGPQRLPPVRLANLSDSAEEIGRSLTCPAVLIDQISRSLKDAPNCGTSICHDSE